MYTQPLSNEPLKPKGFFSAFIIAIVGIIVALFLFIMTGCSSVKKHKSASEYKIDTSGSTYIKDVEVKSKDSSSIAEKKESNSRLESIEIDDTTTLNFGDTGELKKPTVIEQNGTKITTYQPIKNITSKRKSKALNKDTSSTSTTNEVKEKSKDSTVKQAGQTASKKESGSQSESNKSKWSFNFGWLWLALVILLFIYRARILNWFANRKL